MNSKKSLIIVILVAMMAMFAGVVSAQDDTDTGLPGQNFRGDIITIVSEATGLTPREIIQQTRDGATLAEVITANGGDVNAIAAEITAVMSERITERTEERLANLEAQVLAMLNGERPIRDGVERGGIREVLGRNVRENIGGVISEITGLTTQEVTQQVRDGATLAEIITANGGDVDAVTAQVVDNITALVNERVASGEMPQERADDILLNLDQLVNGIINGETPNRNNGVGQMPGQLRDAVVEATGLTLQEIIQQMRDGATLADVLTGAGVDLGTFQADILATAQSRLDEQVADGRITQEQADQRLQRLTDRLNVLLSSTDA